MKKLGRVYNINNVEELVEEFMDVVESKLNEKENIQFKDSKDTINISLSVCLKLNKLRNENSKYLSEKADEVVDKLIEYKPQIAIQALYYKTKYDNLSEEVGIDLVLKIESFNAK